MTALGNAGSGFGLGVRVGNALSQVFSFENKGMIIAHRMPGRRRYTCQALKGRPDLCEHLQPLLEQFPGITEVRLSPVTGSVTVSYNQREEVIDSLFDLLSHNIAGKHAQQEETLLPSSLITVSDNLNDAARGTAEQIGKFFSHAEPLLLSRVAGVGLVALGLTRMIVSGDRPAGPQLLLWGLGLLLRQSHKDPEQVLEPSVPQVINAARPPGTGA